MTQILICSGSFVITPGLPPSCSSPGVLSAVDLSLFVGVSSINPDPTLCLQAFGSGLVILGVPLIVVMVCRIVVAAIFKVGDHHENS